MWVGHLDLGEEKKGGGGGSRERDGEKRGLSFRKLLMIMTNTYAEEMMMITITHSFILFPRG